MEQGVIVESERQVPAGPGGKGWWWGKSIAFMWVLPLVVTYGRRDSWPWLDIGQSEDSEAD